ncbi:type II secretion system protein [Campylobacter sp.]|uniref:type II secretion system protein n=1 Tax=Campylobacter sp. TaxID=205 RepID=UPI002A51F5A6|nr:type II secretion system protein [Campylobacter sp.]MDD7090449.1 type II secretion system protein [Campylobacteraceae bacterium]MDY5284726.1 type II secretion system protein [Campylobacter sp.]
MKKGFTMIELIFVIVILGILASVAIPRLAATREDAEISAAVANLRTLLSDTTSYYAAKGDFNGAKWKDFTNVPLTKENGDAIDAAVGAVGGIINGTGTKTFLSVGGKNCLQIGIRDSAESTYIAFSPVAENKTNGVCATFLASDLAKPLLDGTLPANGDSELVFCKGVSKGGMSCLNITQNSIYKVNNTGN